MSEDLMPEGNGWIRPNGARKFHYFEAGRSLCGRYGFMFAQGDKDTGKYNDSDCAQCVKELKKRRK